MPWPLDVIRTRIGDRKQRFAANNFNCNVAPACVVKQLAKMQIIQREDKDDDDVIPALIDELEDNKM